MRYFLTLLIIVIAIFSALAQPGDPGGDPDVPISGLEILIAAGAALGAKKIYDSSKKKGN